jgi:hypothetical protein
VIALRADARDSQKIEELAAVGLSVGVKVCGQGLHGRKVNGHRSKVKASGNRIPRYF